MENKYSDSISKELQVAGWQVKNTLRLLEEGATLPFISRYRKEATGGLDELQIAAIKDLHQKFRDLDKRREAILRSVEEQGMLSPELKERLIQASSITELEDLYLPYKPKKRTRATIARDKGLEPLAMIVMKQQERSILQKAGEFLTDEVKNAEDALQGARDIIAEWVNENQEARNSVRWQFSEGAFIHSKMVKGKDQEGIKYRDYFDYSEPLRRCPSHRLLAVFRGEEEGFLTITIAPDEEKSLSALGRIFIKGSGEASQQVARAVKDSYKRLLLPSIENEFRAISKEKADNEAIRVFAGNLKQLLLAPPLGQLRVLAIDPGYRTGCKVICLDNQGNLLHNETIYPHPPQNETGVAVKKINSLVNSYKIDAIAIGNGTASRETEHVIKKIHFERDVKVYVVSEAGASVYSASKIAREEFPQYDVTVRGAISIGRRLMDPLAELVKIDPQAIGVGQYQHDVDAVKLKSSLDQVVESCVNKVGVEVNTASRHLLTYVSGLGPQLAGNIIEYRAEHGPFQSREELKKVPRMGPKAFEQSAGFLRVRNGINPLDNSAVHPESYPVVEKIATDLGASVDQLLREEKLREKIDLKKYVSDEVGLPTLQDIMEELAKPGRDPRTTIKVFEFAPDIFKIEDVKEGMVLPGIVTNITNFGVFVDIGVKQDGLVHISQMADRFVSNPSEIVRLHQHVRVKVLEVDALRRRIQLTLKDV
jgi:protein Tex